ncbi:MAG: hypothetical protein WCO78_03030 [Candidatus Roizmanbacteria bacterium]
MKWFLSILVAFSLVFMWSVPSYADPGTCLGGWWKKYATIVVGIPDRCGVPDSRGNIVECMSSRTVCDNLDAIATDYCPNHSNTSQAECLSVGAGPETCTQPVNCAWYPGPATPTPPRPVYYPSPTAGPSATPVPNATATPTPLPQPTLAPGLCMPAGSGYSAPQYCSCGRKYEWQSHCNAACANSQDATSCTAGGGNMADAYCDVGCNCPLTTCQDDGCPGGLSSCVPPNAQVSHNVIVGNTCVPQNCLGPTKQTQVKSSGCWTFIDTQDPCNASPPSAACIWSRSSSCTEQVTRTLCNQTGCCGGVIPPGPCDAPSTVIEVDLREQTGTMTRDPVVPFIVSNISGDFGANPCPSGGGKPSINCDNQIFVSGVQQTIRCSVTLPNLCPIAGSVQLKFDVAGHTSVDQQYNYRDRTTYRYQNVLAYTPANYVKLLGAAFMSRPGTTLTNVMPHAPQPYDTSDPSPLTPLNFAFSSSDAAGVVTNANVGDVVLRHTNSAVGNTHHESYIQNTTWTIDTILNQTSIPGSAVQKVVGSPPTLQQGQVYELSTPTSTTSTIGSLNIQTAVSGRLKGVVILARDPTTRALGNMRITANIPSSTPSLMIVANQITVDASVTEVNAILIANQITFTPTVDSGLKVVGNMVARQGFANGRTLADTARPSVFMKFDAAKYLDLLPLIKNRSGVGNMQQE